MWTILHPNGTHTTQGFLETSAILARYRMVGHDIVKAGVTYTVWPLMPVAAGDGDGSCLECLFSESGGQNANYRD